MTHADFAQALALTLYVAVASYNARHAPGYFFHPLTGKLMFVRFPTTRIHYAPGHVVLDFRAPIRRAPRFENGRQRTPAEAR